MISKAEAHELIAASESGVRMAGWYNDNVLVESGQGRVVVRTKRWTADFDPEPRLYSESSVVRAVQELETTVPHVLYASRDVQIHSEIPGVALASLYPETSPVPAAALSQVSSFLTAIKAVSRRALVLLPVAERFTSATYRSSQGFCGAIQDWLAGVYDRSTPQAKAVLAEIGVTRNPFEDTRVISGTRLLRLCHGDLGRSNCLWNAGILGILDWELALWADPAWDVASLLHRFAFPPEQERVVIESQIDALQKYDRSRFLDDLEIYRSIEIDRSIVVDAVRLVEAWGTYETEKVVEYVDKVARLRDTQVDVATSNRLIELLANDNDF